MMDDIFPLVLKNKIIIKFRTLLVPFTVLITEIYIFTVEVIFDMDHDADGICKRLPHSVVDRVKCGVIIIMISILPL